MLIQQIDSVGFEAFEGGVGDFPDVLGPTVEPVHVQSALSIVSEAEFRGDYDLTAEGSDGLAFVNGP